MLPDFLPIEHDWRSPQVPFAFGRMDAEMEERSLMEAIAIQESILSGRPLSALYSMGIAVNPWDSFSSLIDRFKRHCEDQGPHVEGLVARLREWRVKRNEALHSVCRYINDPCDEVTVRRSEDKLACATSDGRVLVDDVPNTVERVSQRIKNAAKTA
jgi:hypothetical protein